MSVGFFWDVENDLHDIGTVTPHICHRGHRYPVVYIANRVHVKGIQRDH